MFSVDQNVRVELPAGDEACRTLLRAATPQGILACSAFRLITNFVSRDLESPSETTR